MVNKWDSNMTEDISGDLYGGYSNDNTNHMRCSKYEN